MRHYSRFVHISKFSLSLLILLFLVFLVAVPLIHSQDHDMRVAFSSIEEAQNTPPMMINPRFQGVDQQNNPFLVTAETAIQLEENVIMLEQVAADFTTDEQQWLALIARQGRLNLNDDQLTLQGDVQLYHDQGIELRTELVRIDLERLEAFGQSFVQIQGPFGHIQADRFALLQKGNKMLFHSDVHVTLLP